MDPEMNPRHSATQSYLYNHREKDGRKENSGDQEKLSGQMQPRKPHARPQSPMPSQTLELSHSRALDQQCRGHPSYHPQTTGTRQVSLSTHSSSKDIKAPACTQWHRNQIQKPQPQKPFNDAATKAAPSAPTDDTPRMENRWLKETGRHGKDWH